MDDGRHKCKVENGSYVMFAAWIDTDNDCWEEPITDFSGEPLKNMLTCIRDNGIGPLFPNPVSDNQTYSHHRKGNDDVYTSRMDDTGPMVARAGRERTSTQGNGEGGMKTVYGTTTPAERGMMDAYYRRQFNPHKMVDNAPVALFQQSEEWHQYRDAYVKAETEEKKRDYC